MPPREAAAPPIFYPAYCFSASPTYFAWVKLTAHDIHHVLRSRPGYASTSSSSSSSTRSELLFYLNHPIQFVQVTGVIVQYDDYSDRFWSFVVDDGSREVVECMCWKKQPGGNINDQDGTTKEEKMKGVDPEQEQRETTIKSVGIGTVVRVKGTISTFRETRQINIERLNVVPTTNEEVKLIAARTQLLQEVLMRPWVVTPRQQKRLLREAQGLEQRENEKVIRAKERKRRLLEREERHAKRIAREYEAEEKERVKRAEAVRQAAKHWQTQRLSEIVSDEFADLAY